MPRYWPLRRPKLCPMRNPYLTALTALTVAGGAIAAIFVMVGFALERGGDEHLNAGAGMFAAAGISLGAAGLGLLVTLLAGAVIWHAPTGKP